MLFRAAFSTAVAILVGMATPTVGVRPSLAQDVAGPTAVQPLFDLSSPETSPFPSDRFTVAEIENLSRRRVNLPLPGDCIANKSDCEDIRVLNELDGFSTRPLVSIPFDGDIDPSTVAGNVFFVALGDATDAWSDSGPDSVPADDADHESLRDRRQFGRVTGSNQIVWDPATRMLHAKADRLLDQHTRYALVMTSGVRDAAGQPLAASEQFRRYQDALAEPDDRWYRKTLLAAEWAARRAAPPRTDIVALSSFTTQSITYLREKITSQLLAAPPPPAADFNVGPGGTRAVFSFDRIETITHNQQVSPTGPAVPGEPYNLIGARWVPGAVGRIAFGRFAAPDYLVHPGEYLEPIRSRTGSPQRQGSNTLHFTLTLPAGPAPPNGWPVVVFGHGGNGTRATTPLLIASIPASHGLAVICIDLVGHGRGPASTLTLALTDGSSITLPAPGRGFDQNNDGAIETLEGHNATAPRLLAQYSDAVTQIGVDQLSFVRLIQRGIDGDGEIELDASPIYFLGQSFGAFSNLPFVAYTEAIRASFFLVPPGTPSESRRLSIRRPESGAFLEARTPPLLNSAHGLTSIGGVTMDPPYFDETIPFRDATPRTSTVPGAMAIQRLLDRVEWRGQTGDAAVFARTLRAPPAGTPRPTVIFFGRGDRSAPLAVSAALVRDGELADRTVLYRHDLFFAANPGAVKNSHTVYRFQGADAPTNPITVAIQQQFSRFFASDGTVLEQTSPYLETPISSDLPAGLDFIP